VERVCGDVISDAVGNSVRRGIVGLAQEGDQFIGFAPEQDVSDAKATIGMIYHMPQCLIADCASIDSSDAVQCKVNEEQPVSRTGDDQFLYGWPN